MAHRDALHADSVVGVMLILILTSTPYSFQECPPCPPASSQIYSVNTAFRFFSRTSKLVTRPDDKYSTESRPDGHLLTRCVPKTRNVVKATAREVNTATTV